MPKKAQTLDELNKQIEAHIQLAITALEKENYNTYLRQLDLLGPLLEKVSLLEDPFLKQLYQKEKNNVKKSDAFKRSLIQCLEQKFKNKNLLTLSNSGYLAYCLIQEAWLDEYLKRPIKVHGQENYRRSLSPKSHLAMSTRHNINLGMRAIALCVQRKKLPLNINEETIIALDKKVCKAINNYRTKKQTVLHISGITIAVTMTLVCSILTAGAVALTLAAWPVAIAGVITALVFAAVLAINWLTYRRVIPRLLNNIFGKDKFLEGLLNYHDPENGDKMSMTRRQKIALGISSVVAALFGAATGAVTYGFILGLGKLAILPFLAAGTVGAACLPPVGIAIAIVFCFSSIVLLMRPLINIIKAKNFKSMLLQPFKYTAAIFDPENAKNAGKNLTKLKIEKAITYTILGMLSVFTFFGLVILQIQNGAALSNFLSQSLAIGSAIAVGVSYFVSLASVLIGQLPYALNNVAEVVVAVIAGFQNIFLKKDSTQQNQPTNTSSLPAKIKAQVVGGIKVTVNEILPASQIKSDAKEYRLKNILELGKPPVANLRPVQSYMAKKEGPKERYSDYFFFSEKPKNQAKTPEKPEQLKVSPKPTA